MRAVSKLVLLSIVVAGCGSPEQEAPPEVGPSPADFAGTWEYVVDLEGVEDPVTTQIRGSPDGMNWHLMLEGRDPIALSASMSGDSLVTESEPYESILRPGGVTTRVRSAVVLEGDQMVGVVTVTYESEPEDEVVRGTARGTRIP